MQKMSNENSLNWMLECVLMMCVFYTNYKLADESNLNPPSPVQPGRQSQSNGHPRSQDDILSNFCLAITDIAAAQQHCQSITHNFTQDFMSTTTQPLFYTQTIFNFLKINFLIHNILYDSYVL